MTFEPGARSCWHSHGGMILVGTGGIGYHQIEGESVQVLYPGDVALCPPGEKHWHGGSAAVSLWMAAKRKAGGFPDRGSMAGYGAAASKHWN